MTPPKRLEPRRLLDLLSVARHGSFSAAAEATNVSQPALSQSISLLEHEVGGKVLERSRQGVRLNRLGEALAFYAESLESLLVRAREELRLRALGLEGSLSLGITPVTAVGVVPRALALLLEESPAVNVSIVEGLDRDITEMLRRGQLDLVVSRIGVDPAHDDIVEERLFNADWALIAGIHHPLADRPKVKLAELGELQWALPAGGSAFREQMERVFRNVGLRWPVRSVTTNSIAAIKSMVMTTNFVSMMASSLVESEVAAGHLRTIVLEDVGPQHPIGVHRRRLDPLEPVPTRFLTHLRQICLSPAATL
jgi:DNA-binding transcriptional LysR family regulator